MPSWRAGVNSGAPDPLADFRHRPIIGEAQGKTYVGRVIVELWEDSSAPDDARGIAMSADAVNGDHAALARRVAAALPKVMSRGGLFRS